MSNDILIATREYCVMEGRSLEGDCFTSRIESFNGDESTVYEHASILDPHIPVAVSCELTPPDEPPMGHG